MLLAGLTSKPGWDVVAQSPASAREPHSVLWLPLPWSGQGKEQEGACNSLAVPTPDGGILGTAGPAVGLSEGGCPPAGAGGPWPPPMWRVQQSRALCLPRAGGQSTEVFPCVRSSQAALCLGVSAPFFLWALGQLAQRPSPRSSQGSMQA